MSRYALAVRLHFKLLDIGRKPLEPLVVGNERHGRPAHRVAPPEAGDGKKDRQILFQCRLAEVPVHGCGSGKKGLELAGADGHGQ